MLRLLVEVSQLILAVAVAVNSFLMVVLQAQGRPPEVVKALAKWDKLRLKAERVTLLPLSPVPRPPTIREELRGLRPFFYGGPLMVQVRGKQVYVVDDVKRKLLECSMDGKVLRELDFPQNAPKFLSGILRICGNWLWVGFEGPYAFAVDLTRWQIVEERRWKGEGIVAGLFPMLDRTLYVVMPIRIKKQGILQKVIWKLVKISPEGDQQEQVVEGWRPGYVAPDETVYWVSDEPGSQITIRLGYAKFGAPIKLLAEIHAEDLGANSARFAFGDSIVGLVDNKILCLVMLSIRVSEQGAYIGPISFITVSKDGRVRLIGPPPHGPKPVRSVELPTWSICEGQIYSIVREDIGENSQFWLIRLLFPHLE